MAVTMVQMVVVKIAPYVVLLLVTLTLGAIVYINFKLMYIINMVRGHWPILWIILRVSTIWLFPNSDRIFSPNSGTIIINIIRNSKINNKIRDFILSFRLSLYFT